ncbi:retrovirus-related pol polyprotein from transposon TNT 1-94 [Tanacetum coccineum]
MFVCVGSTCADIMADLNIPANDAPVEQAPAVAPPTRTDDQILPLRKTPTSSGPSRHPLRFRLSTFSSFGDNHGANYLLGSSDDNPFVAPPSSDVVIEYVNTLGYPSTLRNVSAMSVNALYQPWRVVLSMINMCLTGKTAGYDRPRHLFVQSIQTFLTDRKNLATASRTSLPLHYSHDENVLNTLGFMGKDERGKAEEGGATESSKTTKVTKPKAAKVTKPAGDLAPKKRKLVKETSDDPLPAKRSKASLVGKRRKAKSPLRLIDEPSDEGVPVEEPAHDDEEADIQRALKLSLKEQGERTQGPARPMVLREPDSEKFQPLPKVQGKGKEKVVEEQAAHDLLTLQTPKKKSPTEQFIFQRHPPMPTESSARAESPSMDAELNLTDSETESDEEASKINARNQEEGQAGPNPGIAAESQLQSSHKHEQMDEEFTTTAYPNVQENLKLLTEDQVILEEPPSSTKTLSSLQNLDKYLSFTDQFFMEKPQEEEQGKPMLK